MDRCQECGFEYHLELAPGAATAIAEGVAGLLSVLSDPGSDVRSRRQPALWSPLEYACHVRDVLLVQRERVLAARRSDRPSFAPMGRDERVAHDGYQRQRTSEVAQQLGAASALFCNVLALLPERDWDRTVVYNFPSRTERSLRWVAVHTVHEVRHHLQDVHRQLAAPG